MKHPQITEEHASDIWSDVIYSNSYTSKHAFVLKLKEAGYILKSPVEEIKERYINFINSKTGMIKREHFDLINDQHAIIFDLEKQIEELKK